MLTSLLTHIQPVVTHDCGFLPSLFIPSLSFSILYLNCWTFSSPLHTLNFTPFHRVFVDPFSHLSQHSIEMFTSAIYNYRFVP